MGTKTDIYMFHPNQEPFNIFSYQSALYHLLFQPVALYLLQFGLNDLFCQFCLFLQQTNMFLFLLLQQLVKLHIQPNITNNTDTCNTNQPFPIYIIDAVKK